MGVCPTLGEAEAERRTLRSSLAELLLNAQLICTHLHELSELCVCALHTFSFFRGTEKVFFLFLNILAILHFTDNK